MAGDTTTLCGLSWGDSVRVHAGSTWLAGQQSYEHGSAVTDSAATCGSYSRATVCPASFVVSTYVVLLWAPILI